MPAAAFLARYNGRTLDAYRHGLRTFFQWPSMPVLLCSTLSVPTHGPDTPAGGVNGCCPAFILTGAVRNNLRAVDAAGEVPPIRPHTTLTDCNRLPEPLCAVDRTAEEKMGLA